MNARYFAVLLLATLTVSCATNSPPASNSNPSARAAEPAYQRSRPEAPFRPVFEEFGRLEGDQLILSMNASLADEQAVRVCDQRPVPIVSNWREPRCLRYSIFGCAEYEIIQGQEQQRCVIDPSTGPCMRREAPQRPPVEYRYVEDCYRAPAQADAAGRLSVFAVPADTRKSDISRRGRLIATVALPMNGSPVPVQLPKLEQGTCFAIADSDHAIGLGGNHISYTSHLFTTPERIAAQQNDELDQAVKQAQEKHADATTSLNRLVESMRSNAAWNGQQCKLPATETLPPRPKLMPLDVIETHVKGLCFMTLASQFNGDIVLRAAAARQQYEYVEAANALKWSAIRAASCARGVRFDRTDLAYVRGEYIQNEIGKAKTVGEGIAAIWKSLPKVMSVTEEEKFDRISSMLDSCAGSQTQSCLAPQHAWEQAVAYIREAPVLAQRACQESVGQLVAAKRQQTEAAEQLAQARLTAQSRIQPKASVPLSAAACTVK